MPDRIIRVGREEPLLDLQSFARPGPGGRVHLSPTQLEQIVRTVSRTREVVVKVTRGATSTADAIAHLRYIDRNGKLDIETDEGERLKGKGVERDLIEDWDLDSANSLGRGPYRGRAGRKPSRLVHNVILSMPKGTSPEKLLLASRDFAREQFALKHRYAFTMHTDQDHPHVQLVIKAVGEDGRRFNIRKATLREWRGLFAQHLRAHGIAANATERAVRGQIRSSFKDGIHRASLRGDSRYLRERIQRIAEEVRDGGIKPDPGKTKLLASRSDVIAGWQSVADALLAADQGALAEKIWAFIGGMPRPLTTNEQLASKLEERTGARERERAGGAYSMSRRRNPKIFAPPPIQAELPMIAVPPSLPPTTELVTKAQLVARHPHLLSVNRVTWALRWRAVNGLSAAVFDSPCGELLIHEPSFVAWFLGLGSRAKPRVGRRMGRRLRGPMGMENYRGGPC